LHLDASQVMLGVDRLDMIKGIPQKLLAFEKFLEEHPEWRGKVLLVQIAVPSRSDVPEYQARAPPCMPDRTTASASLSRVQAARSGQTPTPHPPRNDHAVRCKSAVTSAVHCASRGPCFASSDGCAATTQAALPWRWRVCPGVKVLGP
jgi:Glycosyltransferase family 20